MIIPKEFDEIRPYSPEELPKVLEELTNDPAFKTVIENTFKDIPYQLFMQKMKACKDNLEIQKIGVYPLLLRLEKELTKGISGNFDALNDKTGNHTFISNHRDIVLDSAFLSMLLIRMEFPTTVEIAIGNNLLIYPWIKKLVRVNKSFIVNRNGSLRETLRSSMLMSKYMHFAINQKQENIWIAQREGRAKDSNDHTDAAILKMMAMGNEGSILESLKNLHIAPLTISYEYDPCDYLKAKEFQQKRDNKEFKKSQKDDLDNMNVGIKGYKGRIHYQVAPCINTWLEKLPDMPKNILFNTIAQHIDEEIFRNYRFYPGNYIAADLLENDQKRTQHYSEAEKKTFLDYIDRQMDKIILENKDDDFLKTYFYKMYANPLLNHENIKSK